MGKDGKLRMYKLGRANLLFSIIRKQFSIIYKEISIIFRVSGDTTSVYDPHPEMKFAM